MGTQNRLKKLIGILKESFDGYPWYGVSVMEKLEGIDWRNANTIPENGKKSIAHIVRHMISWRLLGVRKLLGDADFNIVLNSEFDWPDVQVDTEKKWIALISELQETQENLIRLLSSREDSFLDTKVPGKEEDFEFLLYGISEHDIYHLGQIGLLYSLVHKN